MKLFQIIFMGCCLSACALKFVFSESAGYISGWERKGFFSVLHDKKIRFEVNNSYTAKSSEVLLGVEHYEKSTGFQQSPAYERKPFIITAFFNTVTTITFEENYNLIINGKTYRPSNVIVGNRDKDIYSCLVDAVDKSGRKGSASVVDNQCILFEFDISAPPPEQAFNLLLVMMEGNVKSNLDVVFTNRQSESISTH
jgi:hypothetical protein